MRVDKTLSELYDLLDSTYNERLLVTARMAVNTIKKLKAENDRIGIELDALKVLKVEFNNRTLSNYRMEQKNKNLEFELKQIKDAYADREGDIDSYVKVLEEIKEVYLYGQPNHEGEVMVECEDTCDAMYQLAVDATTITDV